MRAIYLLTSLCIGTQAFADLNTFKNQVQPFLQKHCISCHGAEKQKGKIALHQIEGNLTGKDGTLWEQIAEQLTLGDMPPEDEVQPGSHARALVLRWIAAELRKAGKDNDAERLLWQPQHGNRVNHQALFDGSHANRKPASPARIWRQSPQIYRGLNRRMTKDRVKLGQPFTARAGSGFKDYAALYRIDEPTVDALMRNARAMVSYQLRNWPPKYLSVLIKAGDKATDEQIKAALRGQFHRILLRDPSDSEIARFMGLMKKIQGEANYQIALESMLATVFLLPEALYRMELGEGRPDQYGRVLLSSREMAFAISYALTDSAPDHQLMNALAKGQLQTAKDVEREVTRILNNPKIEKQRILRFFEEYFEYTGAIDVFKDLPRGQWRPELLVADTRNLVRHVLEEDKDVLKELLTTQKSFVNYRVDRKKGPQPARIANKDFAKKVANAKKRGRPLPKRQIEIHDYYGLPEDWAFAKEQPVNLAKTQRAGILTQPSWLAAFATNNENDAIKRGKWIYERLMGGVIPDIPITVDAQLPDEPDQPLRHRMRVTREEYCWKCHRRMNPLGEAFEQFNFLGFHRTTERLLDVNAIKKLEAKAKAKADTENEKRRKQGRKLVEPKKVDPIYKEVALNTTSVLKDLGDAEIEGRVKNAVDLIHRLARSDRTRQVFIRHAFRFWMGRNETLNDSPTLIAADRAYVSSGGSMKALITSLLTSDSFLYRRTAAPES